MDLSASPTPTLMSPALMSKLIVATPSACISQPGLIAEITGEEIVLVPDRVGPELFNQPNNLCRCQRQSGGYLIKKRNFHGVDTAIDVNDLSQSLDGLHFVSAAHFV